MSSASITIVCPPELAAGFILAGAEVAVVEDPATAVSVVDATVAASRGVVGVYEPYFDEAGVARRTEWAASVGPVVVAVPSGIEAEGPSGRRARLTEMLQRAIGYHITFGEEP